MGVKETGTESIISIFNFTLSESLFLSEVSAFYEPLYNVFAVTNGCFVRLIKLILINIAMNWKNNFEIDREKYSSKG